jgi:replication factor A1
LLEEGKVYTFTQGQLKVVQNRQYTSIKNPYELTFDKNSDIKPAQEDDSIKSRHYDFIKINNIADVEVNTTIDIIGIVRNAADVSSIVSVKLGNKELFKRELTIADDSEAEIRLTIWGDKAQSEVYDWNSHPIVAFKNVKVGDYGGRSLSTLISSAMQINPKIKEGQDLYNWKETRFGTGEMSPLQSLSTGLSAGPIETLENRKSISVIKDESLGRGDKPDWLSLKVYVINIKHDNVPWYPACNKCNKKVSESMGEWTCEKCVGHIMKEPIYRYVISCLVSDHTGTNWVSMFNDQGEKMLGYTAKQLHDMKKAGEESSFDKVFKDALFRSFIVKAMVKKDVINEEERQKCTIKDLHSIDYVSECDQMIAAINKYN